MNKCFIDFDNAKSDIERFGDIYNNRRAHPSLEMATPAFGFRFDAPVVKKFLLANALSIPETWAARLTDDHGVISFTWQYIRDSNFRAGQDLDVLATESMVYVYHQADLLKTAPRTNNEEVRKKIASVLKKPS